MPREPRDLKGWLKVTWADFSLMIRAEAADEHGMCECVTCGRRANWTGGGIDAGHFLAGRRLSIRFDEHCVHPQCRSCNSGSCVHVNRYASAMRKETVAIAYTRYMMDTYGEDEIDRLNWLRDNVTKSYTVEELREMRAKFKQRTKVAIEENGI